MTLPEAEHLRAARRVSVLNGVISGIGGVILIGSLVFSGVTIRNTQMHVAELNARAGVLKDSIAARESILVRMAPVAARGLGYLNWHAVGQAGELRSSLDARKAVDSLARLDPASRTRTTVHYFGGDLSKAVNTDIVEPALRKLGFTVVQQPRTEGMADVPVNCIWFGAKASINDVRLVALSLTSAGVEIRCIRPFQNLTGPKAMSIEIGGRRANMTDPIWTVERILTASIAQS